MFKKYNDEIVNILELKKLLKNNIIFMKKNSENKSIFQMCVWVFFVCKKKKNK